MDLVGQKCLGFRTFHQNHSSRMEWDFKYQKGTETSVSLKSWTKMSTINSLISWGFIIITEEWIRIINTECFHIYILVVSTKDVEDRQWSVWSWKKFWWKYYGKELIVPLRIYGLCKNIFTQYEKRNVAFHPMWI